MMRSNVSVKDTNLLRSNDEYLEYSPKKLLLNSEKCKNLFNLANHIAEYDTTFPISIELHLTNKCNLNCEWCVDKGIRSDLSDLPYTAALQLLNDIQNLNIGVTIEGGGEPTLYHSFEQFVTEAAQRRINLGLISNGVKPFNWELVRHFSWIRLSVDSSNAEEYHVEKGCDQFENVMQNIASMCKHKNGALIGIGYVLTRRNYRHVAEFLNRIQDMGVDYIQMRIIEGHDELKLDPAMIAQLQQSIADKFQPSTLQLFVNLAINKEQSNNDNLPCIAHSLRSLIRADGSMLTCAKRLHDPIVLGNIAEQRFPDLWNSKQRKEASQKMLNPESQVGCTVCRITKFNDLIFNLTRIRTKNFI